MEWESIELCELRRPSVTGNKGPVCQLYHALIEGRQVKPTPWPGKRPPGQLDNN